MSAVSFTINEKPYSVECPMGQEAYIRNLAVRVDAKIRNLAATFRGADMETLLLMSSILTAGEVEKLKLKVSEIEARANTDTGAIEDELASAIADIAVRLNATADKIQ